MRNPFVLPLAVIALSSALLAQTAPTTATDPQIDQVLDSLQARGKTLKEFTADLRETDTDTIMGNTTTKTGKVWYQVKPNGDIRLLLLFNKKQVGEKPAKDDHREYLLDDGWLTDIDFSALVQVKRQMSRPGEKVNLFQLGKGPLPLPIGQDKKDVYKDFDVAKLPPAKDDPPNTVHLQLTPKPGTDFARKFTTLDFWIDPKLAMPVRIETLDAKKTTDQVIDLLNLQVNPTPGLVDGDFALPSIGDAKGWNIHEEPFEK
jgi:outer membrane lipoprotein-sorting protein